eukprot:TRINITY_DN1516_c0_g1_i14.p1 TRINITY_DN1516_c0_g1~~TRINITY_DN1516_c0_g1_i14.p1  ORF type:complete len:214 (-),score=34.87 TRINITY_DN1516_c0_g1_i14:291-845(-)
MAYAGYVPAKLPPAKLDSFQSALRSVESQRCLEVIRKLCYNVACSPTEEKYRRVKISNQKIKEAIVDVEGGLDVMGVLGWIREEQQGDVLFLPPKTYITMKQVRDIDDRLDDLKREAEKAIHKSVSSSSLRGNDEMERIQAQLEADKRERMNMEAVSKNAIPKPKAAVTAPRIVTGGDVGFTRE